METPAPLTIRFDIDPIAEYDGSMAADMAQAGFPAAGVVYAYIGEACVADFCIEKNGARWHLHAHVDPRWQRKGIASAVYDRVERMALAEGARLEVSPTHTGAAASFWQKRQKSEGQLSPSPAAAINEMSLQLAFRRVAQRDRELSQPIEPSLPGLGA